MVVSPGRSPLPDYLKIAKNRNTSMMAFRSESCYIYAACTLQRRENMSLRKKQIISTQKAAFESMLQKRLADLAGKGIEGRRAEKDTIVRKIKADIKAMNGRLKFFADNEKITADAAKARAERAAGPKEETPASKPEKTEKPKKGGEGGGEKKSKGEKKPAEPKG
jgi:hypothetical protein